MTALLKGVQLTLVPALDKANFEKHHPGEGRGGALCEGEGSPSLVGLGGLCIAINSAAFFSLYRAYVKDIRFFHQFSESTGLIITS